MRGYDFVSIKTIVMTGSCCFARKTTIDSWSVFRSVAEQSNIFFVFRGTNINAQKAPFNLSFRAWQVQPIVIRYLRSSSSRKSWKGNSDSSSAGSGSRSRGGSCDNQVHLNTVHGITLRFSVADASGGVCTTKEKSLQDESSQLVRVLFFIRHRTAMVAHAEFLWIHPSAIVYMSKIQYTAS